MGFLILSDYNYLIQEDIYDVITDNSENIRTDAEAAATAEISSFISDRYDIVKSFPEVFKYEAATSFNAGDIVAYLLPNTTAYNAATAYNMGDFVNFDGKTYKALMDVEDYEPEDGAYWQLIETTFTALDTTVGNIPHDNTKWTLGDNRNKLLMMYMMDMVLYHIEARHNAQNIPQIRIDRYNRAIKFFESVRDGKNKMNLPPLTDDATGESITKEMSWGSKPQLNNDY